VHVHLAFFFHAEDGIRVFHVTGVQTCALPILPLALPGLLTFMALRGFTSALGRAGPVMAISLGGAAANFGLNYAFIHGLFGLPRSEERRVGKDRTARWSAYA